MDSNDPDATYRLADIGFIDFESRSMTDISAGTYRYATDADAIVCSFAIGGGPVEVVALHSFTDGPLEWAMFPRTFRDHHACVIKGEAVWAAWNAGFDKAIWNYATLGFPELKATHVIDVMAQAVASGLPPDLAMAAKMSGSVHKVASGKELIGLFCTPKGRRRGHVVELGTPQSHPNDWAEFLGYAAGDIEAMRSVFLGTRQLPRAEWREYWAMEAINERGIGIDLALAAKAADLAAEDKIRSRDELYRLTGGAVRSVDEVAKITAWLLPRLPSEGQATLTKRAEETNDEGELVRPAKYHLTRKQIEKLIALLNALIEKNGWSHILGDALRVLQIRLYGGSKTPAKFAKILDSHVDGVLYGQYVFNGAAQTGRASSRGVQIHNLARDTLPNEPDVIDAVLRGAKYDQLDQHGTPVSRQLSLIIRPTFVPRGDNVFVWSDWSQIEARVLPWLCDHLPGARDRLDIFRAVDADPTLPDLYTRTAAVLSHVPIEDVTKPMRQRGKVAELALGFRGGVNALQSMAASYGMHMSDAEAKEVVDAWRAANTWSETFSREIWEAVRFAFTMPRDEKGMPIYPTAGRIVFHYMPTYLDGSLLCRLPSGRWLTYRDIRWDNIDVLDDDDKPTGEKKLELMFRRGYGRMKLWPGMFVENFTQATAADVLRGTLVRLERDKQNTRLHSHDEVLLECKWEDADDVEADLRSIMQHGFDWSAGLPIMSEETRAYFYTKHEGSHGL